MDGVPCAEKKLKWKPTPAKRVNIPSLCKELNNFYNTYYYATLSGKKDGINFYFHAITSPKEAERVTKVAFVPKMFFPDEDVVMLASCKKDDTDGLLLLYNQTNGNLSIFDCDERLKTPLEYTLKELISSMEAIL